MSKEKRDDCFYFQEMYVNFNEILTRKTEKQPTGNPSWFDKLPSGELAEPHERISSVRPEQACPELAEGSKGERNRISRK
jgi:hypothetical protein